MNQNVLYELSKKREQCVKHFQMEDGSRAAVLYSSPVHYQEEGEWKEIDNRLEAAEQDGKEVYRNRASRVHVSFARTAGSDDLVRVEKDGSQVSWKMLQPEYASFCRKNAEEIALMAAETEGLPEATALQKMSAPNLNSEGSYENILPGVDLQYLLQGERIKETICLHSKEAAKQPLVFSFTHPGLVLEQEADGSLGLYPKTGGERVFLFRKPYLVDDNHIHTPNVEFRVETEGEQSRVQILPDAAWLADEERAYPVLLDPMTETSKTKSNIEETYVLTGGSNSDDPSAVYSYGSFAVGYSDLNGKMRSYLRFKNLPDIGKGSILYGATLCAWQYRYSTYGTKTIPIEACEVKGPWDEVSLRWANQPSVDPTVLDYKEVGQVQNGNTTTITQIGFDVTRLVRKWYNTGQNYGIMLRSGYENDSTVSRRAYAGFYACENPLLSAAQYPSGIFYYRNVNGLEDYQSYHEQPAGRAGSGYTNDYTGNVVWVHPDVQTAGNCMPVALSHVYNSSMAGTSSRLGYGWMLSCQQRLEASGISSYPYVYTDEDGTKHYFYKDTSDGNKLKDEDGLGLLITLTNGTEYDRTMEMETKDKMVYTFAKDGFLRTVADPDGNTITYKYRPNATQNYLQYITDGTGARLDFTYKEDASLSKLLSVTDEMGRKVSYTYDAAGNLIQILYPDGEKTVFSYDTDHKLLDVTNPEGYGVAYEYVNDFRVPRVSHIAEKGSDGTLGQELNISYENGNTTIFEEPGLDGELSETADNRTTTYHFDNMGQPTDVMDSDGFAGNYAYESSGRKNHKLKKAGIVQKTVHNLLNNPLFASKTNWYAYRLSDRKIQGEITTTAEGYAGMPAAKITKTDADSVEGICQGVELEPGVYTFSAYVKTEGLTPRAGAKTGAILKILKDVNGETEGNRVISCDTDPQIDQGFERLQVTFVKKESESVSVFVGLAGTAGTLWVSGAQLEEKGVPNKLNLVENGNFERGLATAPTGWRFSSNATGAKTAETSDKGRCLALNGKRDQQLTCHQEIKVSGTENDVFHLSCWVKGYSIPNRTSTVSAKVVYTDGTEKWHDFKCNPNISGWQYVSGTFRTDDGDVGTQKTYKAIHVYLKYYNQTNQILYKGMQLIKDDGESYQYDSEGNLVSAQSAAESSHFVSDKKGMLTRLGQMDGTAFEYGYDDKNHLTRAVNSEGVRYTLDYNAKGQPTTMRIDSGAPIGTVVPGRVYYLREKVSGNYLDVKGAKAAAGTVLQMYDLNEGANQKWKIVDLQNGYVELRSMLDESFCASMASTNAEEAAITLQKRNNSASQSWKLHPKNDGSYQISCKVNGDKRGITNTKGDIANSIAMTGCTLAENKTYQDWYFEPADKQKLSAEPADGKVVTIRVRHSGQCIDVRRFQTAVGSEVKQGYFNGGTNQQFRLKAVDDTYYWLEPLHAPGMVLGKYGKNSRKHDLLSLVQKAENDPTQQFRFDEIQPGTGKGYAIICKDGTSMDVIDYTYVRGADIILTIHKTEPQINKWWILEEYSDRMESSMTYTEDGRQVASVTDVRGNTTRYQYDEKNRLLTKMTDAKGQETAYTYDPDTDRLTQVEKQVGDETARVSYTYDRDRIRTISHNGVTYGFTYDIYGNRKAVTVGGQELTHTEYRNKNGLIDHIVYGTGETLRNVYDEQERLVSQHLDDPYGLREPLFENTYDNYGNLIQQSDYQAGLEKEYRQDLIGRTIGMRDSRGFSLNMVYDGKNRVKTLIQKVGEEAVNTTFLYGEVEKKEKPGLLYGLEIDGAQRVAYAYDALARQTKKILKLPDEMEYTTSYSYLPGAKEGLTTNLVSRVENGDAQLDYTYDALGNIVTISENGDLKYSYKYDAMNRLIRENDAWENKTICYTYDLGGNLLSQKTYDYQLGELSPSESAWEETTYEYTNPDWKDQLSAYNGEEITYDAMGNPLNYRGMTLTWRKGRQLESLQKDDGSYLNFVYNCDGARVQKSEDSANGSTIKETRYYWNGDQLMALKDGEDLIQFTYDEKGIPFSMKIGEDVYYYLYNVQGDVVGLLDSNGVEVVSYRYSSWGKILETVDTSDNQIAARNPFRYRGYILDEETGMYYLKSRYYDPETGRFLNADSTEILEIQEDLYDKNLYTYCDADPINRRDAEGSCWQISGTGGVALMQLGTVGFHFSWNLLGWGILAFVGIIALGYAGQQLVKVVKSKRRSKSRSRSKRGTGRPELKKQGREEREKKKRQNWIKRSGKKPRKQPRPHHPSKKGHRKY